MTEEDILTLKSRLLKRYVSKNTLESIPFGGLKEDIKKISFDNKDNVIPSTLTSKTRAFMSVLLASHLSPPVFSSEHISEYESTLQKSRCFESDNIKTEEEIDTLFDRFNESDNIIFRGQREAKWRLYSSLQREWLNSKLYASDCTYDAILTELVKLGREKFSDEIEKILKDKNVDTENAISVLGFLQHHGCPTPLMDWTYSFSTALYFAIDNLDFQSIDSEIDEYFSVYFIEEEHLQSGAYNNLMNESMDTVGSEF